MVLCYYLKCTNVSTYYMFYADHVNMPIHASMPNIIQNITSTKIYYSATRVESHQYISSIALYTNSDVQHLVTNKINYIKKIQN